MEFPLLTDIGIIFGLSTVVILFFQYLNIPSIIGFLITGAIAGPYGLGLVNGIHEVELLAEIGIVLLLFTIGIEFSLEKLLQVKKNVLLGGSIQVFLTVFLGFAIANYFSFSAGTSLFLGFLLSLSSTAVVLNLLQEKAEVDTPHGRVILAILIFQDLIAIPMILLTPFLSGQSSPSNVPFYFVALKILLTIILIFLSARYLIPKLLFQIIKSRNSELFLLSLCSICIGIAWLTSNIGLSLALGAFVAGLIISESEYSHDALGYILPFKDIFSSFFFVSVGMLFNVVFFWENILAIIILTLVILSLKFFIASLAAGILGYSIRTAFITGIALFQIGEFSFVVSRVGLNNQILTDSLYQFFLAVSVLTMIITPFALKSAPFFVDLLLKNKWIPNNLIFRLKPEEIKKNELKKDHLLIIGFGLNGRHLYKVANRSNIPVLILDTNPETIHQEKTNGLPISYGDASERIVLEHANIKNARVTVVAISDAAATRRVVSEIRKLSKNVYVIVRTKYFSEVDELYSLGANEVISEELETSIEIFTRVLAKYLVAKNEIERFISEIRDKHYEMLRPIAKSLGTSPLNELELHCPDFEISTFRLTKNAPAVKKTLSEIDLRKKYGVSVLALNRHGTIIPNPDGDFRLFPDDILFILGKTEQVTLLDELFYESEEK